MLELKDNVLVYPSKLNRGGYSYDLTEHNSTYPPCRHILNQFKGSLGQSAQKLLDKFTEFDNELIPYVEYPNLTDAQNEGVAQMLYNKRVILCDEVGNGKTLQALTVAHVLNGNTLYITKKTLIKQVEEEVRRWYPNMVIHENIQNSSPGIHVTNYEQLSKLQRSELTKKRKLVIIDEAHSAKNKESIRSKMMALTAHNSEYLIMLTGTPIEKTPNDMWNLMTMLDKNMWSSYWRWASYFTEYDVLPNGIKINPRPKNIESFHSILKSYYIRRESERPKPVFIDVPVKLYKSQQVLYNLIKKESYIPQYDLTIPNEISRLIYLRQLCIESSWLTNEFGESVKLVEAIKLIDRLIEENKVIVVFSSFNRPLERLHNIYPDSHLYKTGDSIDFNKSPILCMTYQSGGTGLNLQESHTVILLDLPQSSIIFQQAIGRVDRIGQLIIPTFYVLRAEGTVDMRVNKQMEAKLINFKELVRATG